MAAGEMVSHENWDPHPGERRWYTHVQTGDRGYLVRRDGKDAIRKDVPGQELISKLSDHWQADHSARPLSPSQLASVAYAADQELCRVLGLHSKLKKWIDLHERDRALWIQGVGPKQPEIRAKLHAVVWETLKELAK